MRIRSAVSIGGFIAVTLAVALAAPALRLPWVVTAFLCFGGIVLFDSNSQIQKTWMNTILFLGAYTLIILGLTEPAVENFWRDFAGAVVLISFLFETNSLPWSGRGFIFRSTVPPASLIFILVLGLNVPFLTADATLTIALFVVLLVCYLELFSILRENNDMNSGSFMSALRAAACGVGSLFYSSVFLPEAAKQPPFVFTQVALPCLALIVAVMSLFLKQWRRRYILFGCNWSLFVFWAGLSGEQYRFYAALGALVAGVWTIMMTDKKNVDPTDTKDLYLKLSGWAVPGSFLFSMMIFVLYPSTNELIKQGSAVWLLSFFVYWSGLRHFEFPKKGSSLPIWSWRNSLALAITVAGAGTLAGIKYFPLLMEQLWGGSR
jgi:hypothetical protein